MDGRADLGVDQVTLSLVLSGRLNRALDAGRIGPPRDRPPDKEPCNEHDQDEGRHVDLLQGAPHGLCTTHKDRVNEDLLAFLKA